MDVAAYHTLYPVLSTITFVFNVFRLPILLSALKESQDVFRIYDMSLEPSKSLALFMTVTQKNVRPPPKGGFHGNVAK